MIAEPTFTRAQHERALDLAADKIDFGLSPSEQFVLDTHLIRCDDCRRFAEVMAVDDGFLETIPWDDEQDYGDYDEYSPRDEEEDHVPVPRDRSLSDDDDDEDDELDELGDAPEQEMPEPADSDRRDDDDKEEDEEDEEDEDFLPDGEDAVVVVRRESVDEDADEEEPDVAPIAADLDAVRDDDEDKADEADDAERPEGFAPDHLDDQPESQPEPDPADAEAAAEVEAMSDEELAAVDDVEMPGDDAFPTCAADGVDDAAREAGVKNVDYVHERAEKLVRNDDNVEKTDYGRVAVYRSTRGMKNEYQSVASERPEVSGRAAAAIRNAILRSRVGTAGVERHHKTGKLDGKSLHRVASRDPRLFKRNIAPDPGKFLVWVLVDASASMGGQAIVDAATVARSLAEATTGTPTVRLEVWGWSNPFIPKMHPGCTAGVVRIWQRGQPTTECAKLVDLPMGGTPDAAVLDWAWREMSKVRRSDERAVAIMCSDGWGDYRLPQAIESALKHDVDVKNVALGNYVHEADQEARFGHGNYVPWRGSIEATARPLATMIAKMAAGQ